MHCAWKGFVFSYSHIFKVLIIHHWQLVSFASFPLLSESNSVRVCSTVFMGDWQLHFLWGVQSTHLTNEGKFSRPMFYILCVFIYFQFCNYEYYIGVSPTIYNICLGNKFIIFITMNNYIYSSSFDLMYIVPHHWQLYNKFT